MPAFTFEKISPPSHPSIGQTAVKKPAAKPRSLIDHFVDRLTDRRLKRSKISDVTKSPSR